MVSFGSSFSKTYETNLLSHNKNILLEFFDFYNMTCVYWRDKDKLSVGIKKTLQVVFKKRNSNFAFAFERVWADLEFLNVLSLLKYPTTLEKQLSYLKCFEMMSLWQSNDLRARLCHQSFLVMCLLSAYWKLRPFLESIWFFFTWFLNHRVFDMFIQFKSCIKSASHYFYCFNGSPKAKKSVTMAMCQRACDSISFTCVINLVLAPTMLYASWWH